MIGIKPQTSVLATAESIAPWKQRVLEEKEQLCDKIGKLAAFIAGEAFRNLPESEQLRMARQLQSMQEYRTILSERIDAWLSAVVNVPTDPPQTEVETVSE